MQASNVKLKPEFPSAVRTDGHTILLGGVGGDSHSVGLTVLRQALSTNGYNVCYLGTQNQLRDFLPLSPLCNVVMISTMDGHARRYLQEFPQLVRSLPKGPLWYLGGNLTIDEAVGYDKLFLDMGFDRVFVKFIDISAVLRTLKRDLQRVPPRRQRLLPRALLRQLPSLQTYRVNTPADEVLEKEIFLKQRAEVLHYWKTGSEASSLTDNAVWLAKQPSYPVVQARVDRGEEAMLLQPRSGVALAEEQIKLFQSFKDAGAHVLSYQVDSLTRNNNYRAAEEAIRESQASGYSGLNGFPVINHGVKTLRRIISTVAVPLQTRHSTRDPRLLAEISYAGGVTAFEGGAICYNIPYYKNYYPAEAIARWQYVDRLTGWYYSEFGIRLDREFFGTLTATLIPPSLAIAVNLLEALLAVQQGVKCLSLGYAEQGHRAQDIAAIRVLREKGEAIVRNAGFSDVQVHTVFHQYMAAFPTVPHLAEALVYNSAQTAALSRATRVIVKTPVESYKIPTAADNVQALSLVQRGVAAASRDRIDESQVAAEAAVIHREVDALIDSIFLCGRGSVAAGIVEGLAKGLLDIPFSPSLYNQGKVLTARDCEGAVRYLSTGNLAFDKDLKAFHAEKMRERRRAAGLKNALEDYALVEYDVLQVARGQYEQWPLSR